MSLAPEHAAQLGVYAQLAVGFAGFAGVIGAFSEFRMHAEATAFRVRAMVTLALMEVLFALLPPLIAAFGIPAEAVWRIAGAALALCGTAAIVVMSRQASVLYRVGRLMKVAAWVLSGAAVLVFAPLWATVLGFAPGWASACYFAALFFGVFVCAYHFMLLMVAVRLDRSE
jgi:hypothetical protein